MGANEETGATFLSGHIGGPDLYIELDLMQSGYAAVRIYDSAIRTEIFLGINGAVENVTERLLNVVPEFHKSRLVGNVGGCAFQLTSGIFLLAAMVLTLAKRSARWWRAIYQSSKRSSIRSVRASASPGSTPIISLMSFFM
jgi:hypothetical protein